MTFANIRKIIALALVFALTLLPMAALAEATQGTVTIGNFDVTFGDAEPIHIDAQIRATLGMGDTNGYFGAGVDSDGRPVLNLIAALEDGAVKITADGVSAVYQITLEELEQLMQAATSEAGDLPFDPQQLTDMINAYAKLIEKAASMKTAEMKSVELFEKAGIEMQSKPESAEVMGETMELTRYDFEIKPADIDKIMAVAVEQMPELGEYLDAYFALLEQTASAGGEPIKIDREHLFESLMSEANAEMTMRCTMWIDEAEQNMRMEFTQVVTEKSGNTTTTVELPFTMMQSTDADGTVHMQMDMDVAPEAGSAVAMQFLMNGTDDKGDMAFAMSVVDGETQADVQFGMLYDVDAFEMAMAVSADGTDVEFAMDVMPSGDASRVRLELAMAEGGVPVVNGALGFDVKYEEAAMPAGPLMPSDKPVISISEITEEQMAELQNEGTALALTSLGALMANPGIAQIIADAQTIFGAEVEVQDTTTAELTPAA